MRDGWTLVFETSTPAASLGCVGPGGDFLQRDFASDRRHNSVLFPPLVTLLAGIPSDEPGLVVVGGGPGSYSGTRVGIAAAQGVAIARGCPAVMVPSILATPAAQTEAGCLAIGDARRGSYWTALIAGHRLVSEPGLTDAAGLLTSISHALERGIAVSTFEDPRNFALPGDMRQHVSIEIPTAARLWRSWEMSDEPTRTRWSAVAPQPMYLRPPHITPAKRPSWMEL